MISVERRKVHERTQRFIEKAGTGGVFSTDIQVLLNLKCWF